MTDALPVFTITWSTYVAAVIVVVPVALKLHSRMALFLTGLARNSTNTSVCYIHDQLFLSGI